jgi:hypothetical protein
MDFSYTGCGGHDSVKFNFRDDHVGGLECWVLGVMARLGMARSMS